MQEHFAKDLHSLAPIGKEKRAFADLATYTNIQTGARVKMTRRWKIKRTDGALCRNRLLCRPGTLLRSCIVIMGPTLTLLTSCLVTVVELLLSGSCAVKEYWTDFSEHLISKFQIKLTFNCVLSELSISIRP